MPNKHLESAMLKEINEQPEVIRRIIKGHFEDGKIIFLELKTVLKKLKKAKKLIIIACGSSYYAAVYGKYIMEEYAGLEVCPEYASEFNSRRVKIDKDTAVLAISQSGKTIDVIKAVRTAKPRALAVISISNSSESPLAEISDAVLDCGAGEEKALAATKTFSSTLLLLLLLGLYWRGKYDDITVKAILKLPLYSSGAIKSGEEIKKIADKFRKNEHFLFCGRKFYFPLALEGAHKMKECSYAHAEGLATGELKHGTLAIIEKNTPVFFLLPKDDFSNFDLEVMEAAKNAGGNIAAFTSSGNKEAAKYADTTVYLKPLPETIEPIIAAVFLQLLAYYLSLAKGLNPDKPRNLNKFVG